MGASHIAAQRRASHAPRVWIVFPGLGPRSCRTPRSHAARLLVDGLSGTTTHRVMFPWGLAPCPVCRFYAQDFRGPGPSGFTPRRQIFRSLRLSSQRSPRRSHPAHSKVSDVFEISHVRDDGSIRECCRCRISFLQCRDGREFQGVFWGIDVLAPCESLTEVQVVPRKGVLNHFKGGVRGES